VQGGLALVGLALIGVLGGAGGVDALPTAPFVVELTATGGLLLMGLSLILLDLKKPRIANFLPALAIAPLLVLAADALGVNVYP